MAFHTVVFDSGAFDAVDAPVVLSPSANIAAGAATATTARLTPPENKTSGANFVAGKISDDTNPISGDLGVDQYSEYEWSVKLTASAVLTDQYEFRVVHNDTPLETYSQTPTLTVASGSTGAAAGVATASAVGLAEKPAVGGAAAGIAAANASGSAATVAAGAATGLATAAAGSSTTVVVSLFLSGGASNSSPAASLGGAKSSVAASGIVFGPVSPAQFSSGVTLYRCFYPQVSIATDLRASIQSETPHAGTSIALGWGAAAINATETATANETTAPAGVTFLAPTTLPESPSAGALTAGQYRALWVRYTVTAGTAVQASESFTLDIDAAPAQLPLAVIWATPADYQTKVNALVAGDMLVLAPGNYVSGPNPGMIVTNKVGTVSNPITIKGPSTGARAILDIGAATHNSLRFSGCSYIKFAHIDIDANSQGVNGVTSQGVNHHLTFEDMSVTGVDNSQNVVAYSFTSGPNWDITVRRCTADGAGIGLYAGNSDGTNAFIGGLIEHCLFINNIGYCMQIKHQVARPTSATVPGIPEVQRTTTIRHNVFSKGSNSQTGSGLIRPNVLVGDQPPSGFGQTDIHELYGNFFWQNPTEVLFQGEGHIAIYANVMVNDTSGQVAIKAANQNGQLRDLMAFGNTIIVNGTGISVTGGSGYTQSVRANQISASTPMSGGTQSENATTGYTAAGALTDFNPYPSGAPGTGAASTTGFTVYTDWDKDFNNAGRVWTYRGAYSGHGTNPGWDPSLTIKTVL